MKQLLSLLFLLPFLPVAKAQNPELDSLERLFTAATMDTLRMKTLDEMAGAAYDYDIHFAISYGHRGSAIAKQSNNQQWIPRFQETIGRAYANLSQLDSAMYYFEKALTGYQAVDNKKRQASTYFKMGWVYKRQGIIDEAMKVDLLALRLMEELKDQQGIAGALSRVGEDLSQQGKHEEALQYHEKAIAICEKNNFQEELAYTLRSAGDEHIALWNPEGALTLYQRSISIFKDLHANKTSIADLSNCLGNAYKRLKRYDEAIREYKICLNLSQQSNYTGGISTAIANLGEVNLMMGNYDAALEYELQSIKLQEDNGDISNLDENYTHLSSIYEKKGDYKQALLFHKKSRHIRDSIATVASDVAMSELRTKYDTEKNEATISSQDAQIGLQKKMQWLYIGLALLLGLFAISFYRNAIQRKKTNDLLSIKNAENELLLKEIHHRVKNNLEVVSSLLALQSAQIDDPGIKDAMQEGQNRVQSIGIVHQKLYQGTNLAAVEMKDYFINLSESILDSFGAEDRVTIECAMNNLELDIDTAVPLGLITNEILTNALKYAFPDGRKGKIEIKLERKDGETLQLKIADDGVGKSGIVHGTGFGGQLVSLLTRQLSGTMREEVKGGTAVYFDFIMKKAG